jgi:hypothetical protein
MTRRPADPPTAGATRHALHRVRARGRGTDAAAVALVAIIVAAGCGPEAGVSRHLVGLLALTADRTGAATLTTWASAPDGSRAQRLDLPSPATTWISAGRAGVLVATVADGTLHVSDPVDPDEGSLAWRPVRATDLGGDAPEGPFWFATWDPEGGRFGAIAGDLAGGGDTAVALIDPTTESSYVIALDQGLLAAAPAWVDGERLAVVGGTSADPSARIIDSTTGDVSIGPSGDRQVATSADGTVVATSAGPGTPVVIRATEAWLAGDGTSIGSVDPPSSGATAASVALDRSGQRLAIAWLTSAGGARIDVHDGTAGWRRVASETNDDGAMGAVVAWLR